MEIVYVYQKQRRQFGRQTNFDLSPTTILYDIAADPSYLLNYTVKNPLPHDVQCAPDMSEHEVNTESYTVMNSGIMHKEGGWPKDVDATDAEHTIRYRKKVEKDDDYIRSVQSLGEMVENCIKQNNAIDIYGEYFADHEKEQIQEPPSAKTLNMFRDPCGGMKRSAVSMSWFPENGHKLAVAYSSLQFQKQDPLVAMDSYVWDIEHPNAPDQTIMPQSPLVCLRYNPKDPHILAGGAYNGIVAFWDTRKGSNAVDSSFVEKSHRDPVYNVAWVQSKTGSEFFSSSTDGQVLWWDIRKLSEPTESMILDPEKNGNNIGVTVLEFETTMPTKFMVGAENGAVYMCNRKSKNPHEKIMHTYVGHHGPINAMQRNPFFPRNFLTVGDWTAKVWIEDIRSPIMSTSYHASYLTDGCWSPTRPAVFYTCKNDGSIDVWDYVFKQNEPTLSVQVCNHPLHCLKAQDQGKFIAVGDRSGSVTLLELSSGLVEQQNDEKNIFSQMLEREAKREKTLETVTREKRLKAAQKKTGGSSNPIEFLKSHTAIELMQQAEKEFLANLENIAQPLDRKEVGE